MHRNQQGSHKEMPRWDRQRLNRSPELSPWGVARKTGANNGANKMWTESQIPLIVALRKCGSSWGYHSSLTGRKKFRYTGKMFKQLLINFIDLFWLLLRDQRQRPSWILGQRSYHWAIPTVPWIFKASKQARLLFMHLLTPAQCLSDWFLVCVKKPKRIWTVAQILIGLGVRYWGWGRWKIREEASH